METANIKICPICGGGGSLIHRGTRDNPEIDVYKCSACETKFLSVIQDYDYESGFMNQTEHLPKEVIEERVYSEDNQRRFQMTQDLCRGKTVLDFGCGFGGYLECISKVAADVLGVELGKDERNYLNQKKIPCVKTIDEQNKKWDVITLFHCFEHLSAPKMWLEKLSEYLDTNGKLIIEVPNANDALLELYESRAFADFTYWSAHLFLYTQKSLAMVIEDTKKYSIEFAGQVQRYPIANHLMWLANGKPGGHKHWSFMDSDELTVAYMEKLKELQMCDTLFFVLNKL